MQPRLFQVHATSALQELGEVLVKHELVVLMLTGENMLMHMTVYVVHSTQSVGSLPFAQNAYTNSTGCIHLPLAYRALAGDITYMSN